MARAGSYPQVDFKESQRFLARDPSQSQVVRVPGDSILDAAVDAIKKSGDVVNSVDTLTEALVTDYASGQYVLTGGELVVLDGGQAIYRVSDPGSGGIVMDNGNELVLAFQANSGDAGNYNVGTDSGEIPLNSDLGTAAFLDAQTSPTDTTTSRVLTTDTEDITAGTLYHTGNLNQFEFGGEVDAFISDNTALARTANAAMLLLPISLYEKPTGVDFGTGTFNILDETLSLVTTAVAADLAYQPIQSSGKAVRINITKTAAFTVGAHYYLQSDDADATITVIP